MVADRVDGELGLLITWPRGIGGFGRFPMSFTSAAFVAGPIWIPLPTETCLIEEVDTECVIPVPHAARMNAAAGTARTPFFITTYITKSGVTADGLDRALSARRL